MLTRWTMGLLLTVSSSLGAQLTIENPKKLDVPEQRAQVLFLNINRTMESEFHVSGTFENKFRVRLVLGEPLERFSIDDTQGNGTVYLERWNESKFAISTMRLAMQHLLGPERQKKMLEEVSRRMSKSAPISADDLRKEGAAAVLPPVNLAGPEPCIASGVRGGPCITMGRQQPMSVR